MVKTDISKKVKNINNNAENALIILPSIEEAMIKGDKIMTKLIGQEGLTERDYNNHSDAKFTNLFFSGLANIRNEIYAGYEESLKAWADHWLAMGDFPNVAELAGSDYWRKKCGSYPPVSRERIVDYGKDSLVEDSNSLFRDVLAACVANGKLDVPFLAQYDEEDAHEIIGHYLDDIEADLNMFDNSTIKVEELPLDRDRSRG